jgi:large subunit ribosomal protein L25
MEKLQVRRREETGKAACKRMRNEGLIPATLYHKGDECINVAILDNEFRRVIRGHGESAIVELVFDQDHGSEQQAIYKNLQTDAFKKKILHVDLHGVRKGEAVNITIPVITFGVPSGVTEEGGILVKQLTEVDVRCEPRFIVEEIKIDISGLKLHDSITIGSVVLPEGIEIHGTEPAAVVVSCIEQAKIVIESEEGEEGAGEAAIGTVEAANEENS